MSDRESRRSEVAPRLEAILETLEAAGWKVASTEALAGDVGRRRYLRLGLAGRRDPASSSAVLALYPPEERSACHRFERTSELLRGVGVRVPEILVRDCDRGWMLLEDLGPDTLYRRFYGRPEPWHQLAHWYRRAMAVAARISSLPPERVATLSPPLDGAGLARELEQTWEAFLAPRGLSRDEGSGKGLARVLEGLCRRLGRDLVPCHRDFMVRNLVPLDGEKSPGGAPELAVIDHQDLRLGPRFYDLASLLNDSLFPPAELEAALVREVAAHSGRGDSGLPPAYLRAVVQRTLKAVGTFARHGAHLELIRPTYRRALEKLGALPEGRQLGRAVLVSLRDLT